MTPAHILDPARSLGESLYEASRVRMARCFRRCSARRRLRPPMPWSGPRTGALRLVASASATATATAMLGLA